MNGRINNLYEFGEFRLDTEKCLLWRGDKLVQLSPKALELLCLLVKKQGEIVSKQEIFDTVWAETFVEEGVLTQNIYTLRQTLGTAGTKANGIIETLPRRGYRLNVPVRPLLKSNGEISAVRLLGNSGGEFLLATQTRTEIIEVEIFDENQPPPQKLPPASIPFYRKRSTRYFSFGAFLILVGVFFSYGFLRQKMWAYFHPPLENVRFVKLTDSGNIAYPALSPDGNFMAFVREGSGVFLKDMKSGKDIRLDIPGAASFSSLHFSPDGNSIFFRSHAVLRKPANILQVSRFGGETKIIAEKIWIDFGLSPDGKKIAFIRNFPELQKQILFVKDLASGDEREVLQRNFPDVFFYRGSLAFSPDSSKIAFVANAGAERSTKLFVADAETGREEEIKSPKLRQFEQATWLPDGETLIVSASDIGRRTQLWKILYPGGEAQRLTNGLSSFGKISVSSDGKQILAVQTSEHSNIWVAAQGDLASQKQITSGNTSNRGQTSLDWVSDEKLVYAASDEQNPVANIWTVNTANNSLQPLTSNTDFHSDFAAASADGKFIYFNSNRGRLINVWRIDASGENLVQVTDEKEGLRIFPQISPDGNYLYYLFRTRDGATVRRLNIAEHREETFFENKEMSPAAFLSLSPDGRRLAFLNLTSEIDADAGDEGSFQIAVVSTENGGDVRFFNAKFISAGVRFTPDGKSFDYISNLPKGAKILRQSIEGGEAQEVLHLQGERIFNFAWSKSNGKLALARGTRQRDAVLLTGFD